MTPRLRLQSITITPIQNDPNRFHLALTFPPFERNAAHIIAIARHMESRINSIDLPGSIGLVDWCGKRAAGQGLVGRESEFTSLVGNSENHHAALERVFPVSKSQISQRALVSGGHHSNFIGTEGARSNQSVYGH